MVTSSPTITLACSSSILVVAIVLQLLLIGTSNANKESSSNNLELYDVLVYGANAAGVGAAVTASAFGKYKVKVVDPLQMIGGMAAAGGVALMNQGGCGLTGLSKNWSMTVGQYYGLDNGMGPAPFPRMKESEKAFWTLLNSSNTIDTSLGCHVVAVNKAEQEEKKSSTSRRGCIGQVDFLCSNNDDNNNDDDGYLLSVKASYIIDASYDGDIMTMAGVDHTSGREPRSMYNESLAGVQVQEWSTEESFQLQNITVDPFDKHGNLLKYIDPEPLETTTAGSGDDRLMAFQYFVCLSSTKKNQIPFYPPKGYNPDDFELLLRQTQAVMDRYPEGGGPPLSFFGDIQCYDPIVEKTTGNQDCLFCCGYGPVDSDQPGLNRGWAQANYTTRLKMAQDHRYYIQGSLYFMANDPRMPNLSRTDANQYGYCKDEYEDYGNFPPQLYVRISNRLIGQQLLTQNNIANPQIKSDGVAMGCWKFDQHTVSRHVVPDTSTTGQKSKMVRNEGFFRASILNGQRYCSDGKITDTSCQEEEEEEGTFPWYDVPFGVMVPAKQRQAFNLLVPVCISATSVAYSSARIENMFMDLGSAAGVAVANLLDDQQHVTGHCPTLLVQESNVTAVQEVLQNVYQQKFHGPAKKEHTILNKKTKKKNHHHDSSSSLLRSKGKVPT